MCINNSNQTSKIFSLFSEFLNNSNILTVDKNLKDDLNRLNEQINNSNKEKENDKKN